MLVLLGILAIPAAMCFILYSYEQYDKCSKEAQSEIWRKKWGHNPTFDYQYHERPKQNYYQSDYWREIP